VDDDDSTITSTSSRISAQQNKKTDKKKGLDKEKHPEVIAESDGGDDKELTARRENEAINQLEGINIKDDDDNISMQSDLAPVRTEIREVSRSRSTNGNKETSTGIVSPSAASAANKPSSNDLTSSPSMRQVGTVPSVGKSQSTHSLSPAKEDQNSPVDVDSINDAALSRKGSQWLAEVHMLNGENQELKEKHESMLVMAEKADFECEDALKLEAKVKLTWAQIRERKERIQEIENILVSKVADIEGALQEVIKLKMQDVEYATEMEAARHQCVLLRQTYAKLIGRDEPAKPAITSINGSATRTDSRTDNRSSASSEYASSSDRALPSSLGSAGNNDSRRNNVSSYPDSSAPPASSKRRDAEDKPRPSPRERDGSSASGRSRTNSNKTSGSDSYPVGNPRSRDRISAADRGDKGAAAAASGAGIVPVKRSKKPGSSANISPSY
jgi:hypothetical protein